MSRKTRPLFFQDVAGRDARIISMLISKRVTVDWVTDGRHLWADKSEYERGSAQAEFDALNLDVLDIRSRIATRLMTFIKEGAVVLAAKGITLTAEKLVFDDHGQYKGYCPTQVFTLTKGLYKEVFEVTWDFRGDVSGIDNRRWTVLSSGNPNESLFNFGHLAYTWAYRTTRVEAVRALQVG